jgi:regulatory protein YycH of two-component signal transduction system YycFG
MNEQEYIKKASRLDRIFKFMITTIALTILVILTYLINVVVTQNQRDIAHIAAYDKNITAQIQQETLKVDDDIKSYIKCIALNLSTTPVDQVPNLAKCEVSVK